MSLKIIGLHLSPVSLFDLHACSENCIFYSQCCCSHIMHGISCCIQSLKGYQSYSIYHYVVIYVVTGDKCNYFLQSMHCTFGRNVL